MCMLSWCLGNNKRSSQRITEGLNSLGVERGGGAFPGGNKDAKRLTCVNNTHTTRCTRQRQTLEVTPAIHHNVARSNVNTEGRKWVVGGSVGDGWWVVGVATDLDYVCSLTDFPPRETQVLGKRIKCI